MKTLINQLQELSKLSEKAVEHLISKLHPISISKKEIFDHPNEVSHSLYIIESGAVREFFVNQKGNDISAWFGFESDIAVCLASFLSSEKGYTGLQSLEDCTLLQLKKDDLFEMYHLFPEMERLGRIIVEQYFIKSEKYAHGFHHLSATERYELLIKSQPEVSNRISVSHIASFLGISVETLSRIRAKKV